MRNELPERWKNINTHFLESNCNISWHFISKTKYLEKTRNCNFSPKTDQKMKKCILFLYSPTPCLSIFLINELDYFNTKKLFPPKLRLLEEVQTQKSIDIEALYTKFHHQYKSFFAFGRTLPIERTLNFLLQSMSLEHSI